MAPSSLNDLLKSLNTAKFVLKLLMFIIFTCIRNKPNINVTTKSCYYVENLGPFPIQPLKLKMTFFKTFVFKIEEFL